MATTTELYREILNNLGVDCDTLPDNLSSTLLTAIAQNCGGVSQEEIAEAMESINEDIIDMGSKQATLPQENGNPNHGTAGQFAVSDGNGGIEWKTLAEAEEVAY